MGDALIAIGTSTSVAILAAIAYRLHLQLKEVRRAWEDHVLDHERDASEQPENGWGPSELERVADAAKAFSQFAGEWLSVVIVSADCSSCRAVVEGLPAVLEALRPYRLAILSVAPTDPPEVPGVPVLSAGALAGLPTPSAVLIDPTGTAVGGGAISTAGELAGFLGEGRRHGFGPVVDQAQNEHVH